MATADAIFKIDSSMNGFRLLQARRLQTEIAEILIGYHESIITTERKNLKTKTQEDFAYGNALAAVQVIALAAEETPWNEHLNSDPWKQAAHHTIENHMRSMQHIERSWHKDNS